MSNPMMEQLDEFCKSLKKDDSKVFKTTPRDLIGTFGWSRRTPNCQAQIDAFLIQNDLEVEPGYADVWIDSDIILKHTAKKATTKLSDPVKKVKLLDAANKRPVTVKKESSLKEAISKMVFHNYSQLPVMAGERSVIGFISWQTIGTALVNGVNSDIVKDYMSEDVHIISYSTPLLNAIRTVYANEFVVVSDKDKSICGIVTSTDISSQFLIMTEPFLLLEQVENYIRKMLNNRILQGDLIKFCKAENDRDINSIDDLTFGEYIRVMQNPAMWDKLDVPLERGFFISKLDKIREIRNDIMHFDPQGISPEQLDELRSMSHLLSVTLGYREQ